MSVAIVKQSSSAILRAASKAGWAGGGLGGGLGGGFRGGRGGTCPQLWAAPKINIHEVHLSPHCPIISAIILFSFK